MFWIALTISLLATSMLCFAVYFYRTRRVNPEEQTPLAETLLCNTAGIHAYKDMAVHYEKVTLMDPRLVRVVIRSRYQTCTRCLKEKVIRETRRVRHDWSYPERLFPKVDAPSYNSHATRYAKLVE